MDDERLLRYSRQILLPEIGIEGQARLAEARVLIIGLGGLGSPAALYLAASGVGRLDLADGDQVDVSNLPRQILYDPAMVGLGKSACAAAALKRLNPDVAVHVRSETLQDEVLAEAVQGATVVVDATDNFASRFAINRACAQARIPVVSAAVIRFEGQISVFRHDHPMSPCYHCLYPEGADTDDDSCVRNGVLAPAAGVLGVMQALETIKLITGAGTVLEGRLLLFDALNLQWREVRFRRDPQCPVCAGAAKPA